MNRAHVAVMWLFLLSCICGTRSGAQSMYSVMSPTSDGSSTGLQMPNGMIEHAYHRAVMLLDGASLRLLPGGTYPTRISFVVSRGAGAKVSGELKIYLSNVATSTREFVMTWSDIIAGMTNVYSGPFVVPDSATTVDLTLTAPFQYGGRSMYAAYEFQSSGPFTTKNAVFTSNVTLTTSMRSGFSSTALPDVLTDISDFRPVVKFSFPLPATQWATTTNGSTADLNAVELLDDANVWMCSPSGGVTRTTDMGFTWIDAGSVQDSVHTFVGLSAAAAFTVAGNETQPNRIYVTVDGGATWKRAVDPNITVPIALAGKTSVFSFWCLGGAAGDTVSLLTSVDQGNTWSRTKTAIGLDPGILVARGSGFRIGNTMWFGTRGTGSASGRVYRSTTGTAGPWKYAHTGRPNVVAIAFSTATGLGLAGHAGILDTISRSADGGLTWSGIAVPGLGEVNSVQYYAGGQDAWAATSTGIWWTGDGGFTWKRTYTTGSQNLKAIRFSPSSQYAYAVGSGGLVAKGTWVKVPVVNVEESAPVPAEYLLSPNYPNPFNASTWVEYSLPFPSHVSLKVIDVLGREVATLLSGDANAGRFKVQWIAGAMPSGVYFCRLDARPSSGLHTTEHTQTQKLILIK